MTMALRDQPYLPLYIKDFLTDEKLSECSPHATGIYIRLMCIMHKSEKYGTVLLKQKDKQTENQILNFATKVAKHMPYSKQDISDGLTELIHENVLQINGDFLEQKRMIKDGILSEIRSKSGSKGGYQTHKNNKDFGIPNLVPNTANANGIETDIDINKGEVKNFFTITGVKILDTTPFEYYKKHCTQEMEANCLNYKISLEDIKKQHEIEYISYDFENLNHLKKSVTYIMKNMNKPKYTPKTEKKDYNIPLDNF